MVLSLRNRLKILIYIGAGAVFVMSLIDGGPNLGLTQQRLALLEVVLFVALILFDRYVWRWWRLPSSLKTGPILRGTWKGVVRPTRNPGVEIEAYLSVRQTYSSVSFRLLTEEMTSESSTARLLREVEGLNVGEYSYQSTPRDSVRSRSPIHFGAVRFECVGERPERMEGSYFTSRQTTGEIEFADRRDEIAHTFVDAKALFQ
jgi:hypothetical protein